jgi:Rps23 Pro-64 3,4-dihydroxylase Tpa1-like proline 4-hydroxylase
LEIVVEEELNPIDARALRTAAMNAAPFPHICIDNFLQADFANAVADAFPTYAEAQSQGEQFAAVNERGKIQITDSRKLPPPILRLNEVLSSKSFVDLMSFVFEIPKLLPDEELVGGGIHLSRARGHLDVHVDFNYLEERKLYRRLNVLVYFNKAWQSGWGGNLELWERDVKVCRQSYEPLFNRCIVFATSDISFHGVTAIRCPQEKTRKSFAGYYYTREAPAGWEGRSHSTIFKARPEEVFKGYVLMPVARAYSRLKGMLRGSVTYCRGMLHRDQ